MKKFSLVGVDGNAFAVMGYVQKAMRQTGVAKAEIDAYLEVAMSGDYDNLLRVSQKQILKINSQQNVLTDQTD